MNRLHALLIRQTNSLEAICLRRRGRYAPTLGSRGAPSRLDIPAPVVDPAIPLARLINPLLALLCILFLMGGVAHAAQQQAVLQDESETQIVVLDDIELKSKDDSTIIDVHFSIPLEYVKHFPQSFGEIVQFQLRMQDSPRQRTHKEVREGNELLPVQGQQSLLVYVTYEEGVPGGPFLTLRFAHPVRFEVHPGSDSMSLSVIVHDEALGAVPDTTRKQAADKSVDLMMAKARQAITFGNNSGAIDLLRKIIRMPESIHTQDANELLGLAYERDNQIPRAKFEYKKYLKRYPEGEGASRVAQRLAALREQRPHAKRRLRESKQSRKPNQFITFGRLSQFYTEYYVDRDLQGEAEAEEQTLLQRILSTYLTTKMRYRSDERVVQVELGASHLHDYLAKKRNTDAYIGCLSFGGTPAVCKKNEDKVNEMDIKRLYVDIDDKVYKYTARVGRQSSRNGGVFGTFDGAIVGYQVAPRWQVSGLIGKPLLYSYTNVDLPKKSFVGVKADMQSESKEISSDMFFIRQKVDGILDRQAIGGDLRFAKKDISVFGMVDYDVSYRFLNLLNLRLGWNYTKANKLNFTYNRRSLLFTSNVLGGGQSATTVQDLLDSGQWTENDIRDAAEERTRVDESLTIGNTYQIRKDLQVSFDVTTLRSSFVKNLADPVKLAAGNTPENSVIYGSDATSNQHIYSMQWVSSNTFIERDLYMLGLRHSDFSTYRDTSLYLNSRIPLFVKWRPGFRLNIAKRDSQSYGEQLRFSPMVNVDYRAGKSISFEAELGFDFVENREVWMPDEVHKRLRIGYNYTF